jgi:hypothetical protein
MNQNLIKTSCLSFFGSFFLLLSLTLGRSLALLPSGDLFLFSSSISFSRFPSMKLSLKRLMLIFYHFTPVINISTVSFVNQSSPRRLFECQCYFVEENWIEEVIVTEENWKLFGKRSKLCSGSAFDFTLIDCWLVGCWFGIENKVCSI